MWHVVEIELFQCSDTRDGNGYAPGFPGSFVIGSATASGAFIIT